MKEFKRNAHGLPRSWNGNTKSSIGRQSEAVEASPFLLAYYGIPLDTNLEKGDKIGMPIEPWDDVYLDEVDNMSDAKELMLRNYIEEFHDQGLTVKVFSENVKDILHAIRNKKKLDGIDIAKKIRDSKFRFLSLVDPELSYDLTNSYADLLADSKMESVLKASQASIVKRQESADEFARKMKEIIADIQQKTGAKSQRSIIHALNENGITAHRGGKWHKGTLQELYNRWNDLGID